MQYGSLGVVSACALSFVALGSAPFSQAAGRAADESSLPPEPLETLTRRFALEGVVRDAGGAPSAGATVASSAGGLAVADADGRYRIEVDVALDAACVQVTASAAGRAASATVALPARAGSVAVVPLALLGGATCEPSWVPTFGEQAGTNGVIRAFATYDDGGGPALYVGGTFTSAGGIEAAHIARWDGSSWSPLGNGLPNHVYSMVAHDDGSGPALFAGGRFQSVDGMEAQHVAKWDGTRWLPVGTGLDGTFDDVLALAVFDDGGGPELYAGGQFTNAGATSTLRVAKWDGSTWSALGPGLSGGSFPPTVTSLAVFDDGGGPALYAGGWFGKAGALTVANVARWDGTSWSALGSGTSNAVHALAVHDDGGGSALYVGGGFGVAGGADADRIARWDGTSWSPVGSGTSAAVRCLSVLDDGGGPALYAGGDFVTAGGVDVNGIARWDGASWQPLDVGMNAGSPVRSIHALGALDEGGGAALFAGGSFLSAGAASVAGMARWEGASWSAVGGGAHWVNGEVRALVEHGDGSGPALYVGGSFTSAGSPAVSRVGKWDGASWTSLGLDTSDFVYDLAVHDDGGGPELYACGGLEIGGQLERVARWDGSSWSSLPGIDEGWVDALATFDDGGGSALYAAGHFPSASGAPANHVARWNGTGWSALGSGVGGLGTVRVDALAVHDDGGGPALFAGGNFATAGGATASQIARWDGSSWSAVGGGVGGNVYALTVHEGDLYAGGTFPSAGGSIAHGVARWNGSSWSQLGGGIDPNGVVFSLASHDDGAGAALYAAGRFVVAGGLSVANLARWDGSGWSALGRGANGVVLELASGSDHGWPALYVGGQFGSVPDSGDAFIAQWGCLDLPPVLDCPHAVHEVDALVGPPGATVTYTVGATDDHDPAPSVVCVPPSGSFFPRGTTIVMCTATDANGHVSTCEFPVVVQTKVQRKAR